MILKIIGSLILSLALPVSQSLRLVWLMCSSSVAFVLFDSYNKNKNVMKKGKETPPPSKKAKGLNPKKAVLATLSSYNELSLFQFHTPY